MGQRTSPLLSFVVPDDLLKRIDDYRFRHRFKSRAAAIKHLIEWALNQNAPAPNGDDQVK